MFFEILGRKECFSDKKSQVLKSPIYRNFPQGLKMVIFLMCVFRYFGQKRMLFSEEKSRFRKVQKIDSFQRGQSMVFDKKWLFFLSVFFGQIDPKQEPIKDCFINSGQKRMLFLQEKSTFKEVKKMEISQRGQSMAFVQIFFFHWCVLGKSSQKRLFLDIVDRKKFTFFQRSNSMILVKNVKYFQFPFLGNKSRI